MAIIVCPLSRASHIARERGVARAVSLLDPGTPFPVLFAPGDPRHLRLEMHDIDADYAHMRGPARAQVDALIAFVTAWDRSAPILIHCYAGLSRSTASAFITACAHNPESAEIDIAWALRGASRTARPNRRLVALADAALAREGRMIGALDAIGPGEGSWEEIGEAPPFTLGASHAARR